MRWSSFNTQQWGIYQGNFALSSEANNYQKLWKLEHMLKLNVISLSLCLSHKHMLSNTLSGRLAQHSHNSYIVRLDLFMFDILIWQGNVTRWLCSLDHFLFYRLDGIMNGFIRMCDNTVCSFLSVIQAYHSQPHVKLHASRFHHHSYLEGTTRTMTGLLKCHLLNLEVRGVIMYSDMSQCSNGCLAVQRPITQHYVAMTKHEAEISEPQHRRHAHPPCRL